MGCFVAWESPHVHPPPIRCGNLSFNYVSRAKRREGENGRERERERPSFVQSGAVLV